MAIKQTERHGHGSSGRRSKRREGEVLSENISRIIEARRSMRKFLPRRVLGEHVERIIDAGLLAPSSKNTQPWRFVILEGDKKAELLEIVKKNCDAESSGSTSASFNAIRKAPVLILVFNSAPKSGGENNVQHNMEGVSRLVSETLSIGACIENMLLMATSLGLGSLWVGDLRNAKKAVEEYFDTKKDLIAGIAIGYPNQRHGKRNLDSRDEFFKL